MNEMFFSGSDYFIDEKVRLFKFENIYNVFSETGDKIGAVRQRITTGQKILSLLINKKALPFKLEIINIENRLQATIYRGWMLFMSKIVINDANGNEIARIKQHFGLLKSTFKIEDSPGNQIAEIRGDWRSWKFIIKDGHGIHIGSISKKWGGIGREMLSADKYRVHLDPNYNGTHKMAILSAAITIDMVLRNGK